MSTTRLYGKQQFSEARTLCTHMLDGALSARRVRLAAYLGNPAAQLAFGRGAQGIARRRDPLCARKDLRQWLAGLRPWGKEAWVRAATAVAQAVLADFERRHPGDPSPRYALEATTDWVSCPCPEHARRARVAVRDGFHNRLDFAACVALRAAQAAGADDGESFLHAARAVDDAAWVLDHPHSVRQVVRRALVPWALGYGSIAAAA